jgi:hypothetical protein
MKRITVNLPDEVYQALAEYQTREVHESLSQAITALAAQTLGVDVPLPKWGDGLRFRMANVFISVANGQARVSRTIQGQTTPAANWEALEDEALGEVGSQGGFATLSAIYACSPALAQKATWE